MAATATGMVGAAPSRSVGARPAAEQALWEGSPSVKAMAMNITTTTLFALVVSAAVFASYRPALRFIAGISTGLAQIVADDEPGLRLAAVAFVIFVVGARIARLLWRVVALRSQHYRLTNQRLLLEQGVFSKTITEIDLRTVDEITFRQSFSERLLGVGEITVISSEPGGRGNHERVRLAGILDPRNVRESLRTAAYDATGSQVFMRST
jgi:uncharacterized membrane protein YdbT with pleckstrin-like domain